MLDCDNFEFLSDDVVDGRWCGSVRERNAQIYMKANDKIKNAQNCQKRDYDRKHNRQMVSSVKCFATSATSRFSGFIKLAYCSSAKGLQYIAQLVRASDWYSEGPEFNPQLGPIFFWGGGGIS